ncbi:hypothetical protein GGX14DRAFT_558562 [Mycena pura]|uniref:Uncharacterized protein n=1 Tax=Mycena pura TaxID=153505 RepID=A0AAD7E1I4_9AGAR|nr:hypothetical protein GGX14DRAFT_558562 [Mycena pura]
MGNKACDMRSDDEGDEGGEDRDDGEEEEKEEEEEEPEEEVVEPIFTHQEFTKAPKSHHMLGSAILPLDNLVSEFKFQKAVWKKRIAVQANSRNGTSPVINNHFTIPSALLELFPHAAQSQLVPAPVSASTTAPLKDMLLSVGTEPGPKLLIADLCKAYELDDSVLNKLADEGYKTTASFCFVSLQDLERMSFHSGVRGTPLLRTSRPLPTSSGALRTSALNSARPPVNSAPLSAPRLPRNRSHWDLACDLARACCRARRVSHPTHSAAPA